jgi:hypothetical protein
MVDQLNQSVKLLALVGLQRDIPTKTNRFCIAGWPGCCWVKTWHAKCME